MAWRASDSLTDARTIERKAHHDNMGLAMDTYEPAPGGSPTRCYNTIIATAITIHFIIMIVVVNQRCLIFNAFDNLSLIKIMVGVQT